MSSVTPRGPSDNKPIGGESSVPEKTQSIGMSSRVWSWFTGSPAKEAPASPPKSPTLKSADAADNVKNKPLAGSPPKSPEKAATIGFKSSMSLGAGVQGVAGKVGQQAGAIAPQKTKGVSLSGIPDKDHLVNPPGDGNCLFYAITTAMKKTLPVDLQPKGVQRWEATPDMLEGNLEKAHELFGEEFRGPAAEFRQIAAKWLEENPKVEINGFPVVLTIEGAISDSNEVVNRQIREAEQDIRKAQGTIDDLQSQFEKLNMGGKGEERENLEAAILGINDDLAALKKLPKDDKLNISQIEILTSSLKEAQKNLRALDADSVSASNLAEKLEDLEKLIAVKKKYIGKQKELLIKNDDVPKYIAFSKQSSFYAGEPQILALSEALDIGITVILRNGTPRKYNQE